MRTIILSSLLLGSVTLHAQKAKDTSADYLNFIIQIQNNEHQTTHKIDDITPKGNRSALRGVVGSSVFQLWSIHRTQGAEHLLDEKIVSSYHPEATITITSADPHSLIPRTRVDQPFQVEYTISGLITDDPKVQAAAKSVVLEHQITKYGKGQVSVDASASTRSKQKTIRKNGLTSNTTYTSIRAKDLTTVRGEEVFTIYAKPDFGVTEASRLARAKVQIWPIAQGTIKGFDQSTSYSRLPDLNVDLIDLYPSSKTYIRAYQGKPTNNPKNPIIINTSYVVINDIEPKDRRFTLNGLDEFIKNPGSYTLELIHETPFGADILHQVYPLSKKSGIKVIGNLNSSE